MGLLNNLLGSPAGAPDPPSYGFRNYVSVTDGDTAYDTEAEVLALISGTAHADYRLIWQRSVPAQQRYAWGFGSAGLPANQGYCFFASLDEGTNADIGVLRMQQANATNTKVIVVAEIPDSSLHGTTLTTTETARLLDRNSMIALPEKTEYPLIREDSLLQLTYALVTAATTHDAVAFQLPTTIYQ